MTVGLWLSSLGAPAPAGPLMGSYNGGANYAGAAAFASETGITPSIYSDYLDGSSWAAMVGSAGHPPFPLPQIQGHLGSQTLEISVPLVHAGYATQQAALAAYNGADASTWTTNLTTLADNLVATGFGNVIIRLMWEPDSGIYSNGDLTSAANYAAIWQSAHTAMMGVGGAAFTWAWYFGGNFDATTNNTAYPGDSYVDTVTFDFYDQSWNGSCGIPYNGTPFTAAQENCLWANDFDNVLGRLASFASAHTKPISFGEFGVINRSDNHGGKDDPQFVVNLRAWVAAHNVAWMSYFNFNSGGDSVLAHFPNSLTQFQTSFG